MTVTSSPLISRETQIRKADHLRICIDEDVQFHQTTHGLDRYRFTHCCLPELNRDELDLSTYFLGKSLAAPLLISSMTGGTEQARLINTRLAAIAQRYGLAMGVGSQRVAVENPELKPTFSVRAIALIFCFWLIWAQSSSTMTMVWSSVSAL